MLNNLSEEQVRTRPDEDWGQVETIELPVLPLSAVVEDPTVPTETPGAAGTFTRNSILSVGRLLISTLVALVLPAFLTHHLPVKTYSAWILILQMSAYVGYLDFGIQTGISKYVAEFAARGDHRGASQRASAGLLLMLCTSSAGVVLTLILAWRVPELFREMPAALYRDVRLSLVFVGVSLSIGMLCSICSAVFLGLQRYGVPMLLSLVNRFLFTGAVVAAVFFHSSLAVMGAIVAGVNLATGGLQIVAWRRLAVHIHLSLRDLDRGLVRQMLQYCSALAIWTVGMLCVSGLDVTIVGRYDFGQTAFYSIATGPTNFMISIIGAALAPLLPTASAESVHRGPVAMGEMLSRVTRYSAILLVLSALPLLVGGYWLLRLWVGPTYAAGTIGYLRILVLANVIRNLCLPYAGMLVATESQKVAIAGASAEAIVNVSASIYLARHLGAIGVAYGTLLGAFVSVGMHFAVSMHYTSSKLSISRARLFLNGMLRSSAIAVPTAVLFPLWWSSRAPAFSVPLWLLWGTSTVLLAWFGALSPGERSRVLRSAKLGVHTFELALSRSLSRR